MAGASRYEFLRDQDPVNFAPLQDPPGVEWLAGLADLVRRLCDRWRLQLDRGPVRHGYRGVVVPVRRERECLALKVTWPAEGSVTETAALHAWQGRGTALLSDAATDDGALLLERLSADRTLANLPLFEAAAHAGRLAARLAVSTEREFPSLRDLAVGLPAAFADAQVRLGNPMPPRWVRRASELAVQLGAQCGSRLIHADLHYENVLAATREPWLAIDPRPVLGEPEYSLPELMWRRIDEVDDDAAIRRLLRVLADAGELNLDKARGWVLVRCVDYGLWGLRHGLTVDPQRCARIINALL